MADKKISDLTAVTTPDPTDLFEVEQGGTSKKETLAQIHTNDAHAGYSEYAAIADPSAPAAGNIRMYARALAGRMVPRFIGPSGLDSAVQPAFFANNVTMWLPGTGTTQSLAFGVSWTTATTQAHPTIAATNFMTSLKRATYTTTTTANNASGVRSTVAVCWVGNIAGAGGFFFAARFGIATYQSAMQVFVGLSAATTVMAGDPNAMNNSCGLVKNTGETVWKCSSRDATAVQETSTGRTTAAAANAEIFDFYMFCKPNDTGITFRVMDVTSGTVLVDNVTHSTHIPGASTMLLPHAECRAVTGGTAVAIFLNKLYIESDN